MVQAEVMADGQGGDSEGGERLLDLMTPCEELLLFGVTPHANRRGEK